MPANEPQASVFEEFVEDYESACARGVSLSGESRDFFLQQRIAYTALIARAHGLVETVFDFGCGIGHSAPYLQRSFEGARVIGLDTSAAAIAEARRLYDSQRVQFVTDVRDALELDAVDLTYSNGTFHHIEPRDRPQIVKQIFDRTASGGLFVLWENNPWNPGTRWVMRRIPFDRDAKPLSYRAAERLLNAAGFKVIETTFHFYFPRFLQVLRCLEPSLRHIPLGAQYCVLARKPAAAGPKL